MYFMLECQPPFGSDMSLLTYIPDRMPNGLRRQWMSGARFVVPPAEPIKIEILEDESALLLDYYDSAISLMTRDLARAVTAAGVDNIDFYETEIHELKSGDIYRTHLAFNLIGAIEAADLEQSNYSAVDGPLISVDFESLVIDSGKTRGERMFRLAESVNGVVVDESVKMAIEKAGIDTLTFFRPEHWVG